MGEITQILSRIDAGDPQAAEQLLPLVYDELRQLAGKKLAQEMPGQTLQATALVHEAYLRLAGGEQTQGWDSSKHFLAAAAEAMRRIRVDNARRKKTVKHGGAQHRIQFEAADPAAMSRDSLDLLALDEALGRFSQIEPLKAELVKLRFFAGLTMPEAAEALGISLATAERHWTYARTWLFAEMTDGSEVLPPNTKK